MRRFLAGFRADERGATAIEYGLIAALVCVVILVALQTLSGANGGLFDHVMTRVTEAIEGALL